MLFRGFSKMLSKKDLLEPPKKVERIKLDPASKLNRLKTMEIFVLDNSLRETNVVQIRGHVLEDKEKIFFAVLDSGLKNLIVASFGDTLRVEDQFLRKLKMNGLIGKDMYAFCELEMKAPEIDVKTGEKTPSLYIPLGLKKILMFGIPNVIIEMDFVGCTDKFSIEDIFLFIKKRIDFIKIEKGFTDSKIFINYRDALTAWHHPNSVYRERMIKLTTFLAKMQDNMRIFGLLYEEPGATQYPWEYTELSCVVRNTMIDNNWEDGQLLLHVHKGYGLADACVLEALSSGCTGVWGAVCTTGAGVGHVSSLVTLTNLARLNNKYVLENYDFPKLRKAAIAVTHASTGNLPSPIEEVYGDSFFDVLWDASSAMSSSTGNEFCVKGLFGITKQKIRISTFTTGEMFKTRLCDVFGDQHYSLSVCNRMRETLHQDLLDGKKYNYQIMSGLFDLYRRSGGHEFLAEMSAVMSSNPEEINFKHNHLIIQLKQRFDNAVAAARLDDSSLCLLDNEIDKLTFYKVFLSEYVPPYGTDICNEILSYIDIDSGNTISWDECFTLAQFVIEENIDDSNAWSCDYLLKKICQDYLLPIARQRILGITSVGDGENMVIEFLTKHMSKSDLSMKTIEKWIFRVVLKRRELQKKKLLMEHESHSLIPISSNNSFSVISSANSSNQAHQSKHSTFLEVVGQAISIFFGKSDKKISLS